MGEKDRKENLLTVNIALLWLLTNFVVLLFTNICLGSVTKFDRGIRKHLWWPLQNPWGPKRVIHKPGLHKRSTFYATFENQNWTSTGYDAELHSMMKFKEYLLEALIVFLLICFKGLSTFAGYLLPKPSLQKDSRRFISFTGVLVQNWTLTIRLFSVIYRTLVGGVLPLCREAVGVFCSSGRLGHYRCFILFLLRILVLSRNLTVSHFIFLSISSLMTVK